MVFLPVLGSMVLGMCWYWNKRTVAISTGALSVLESMVPDSVCCASMRGLVMKRSVLSMHQKCVRFIVVFFCTYGLVQKMCQKLCIYLTLSE